MLLDFTSVSNHQAPVGVEKLRSRVQIAPPQQFSGATSSDGTRYRSLPLYDAKNSELHHIGDLAQAVIDRYDIVRRRRAARLRREANLAQRS